MKYSVIVGVFWHHIVFASRAGGAAAPVAAATQDASDGKPAKGPYRKKKVLSPQAQVCCLNASFQARAWGN